MYRYPGPYLVRHTKCRVPDTCGRTNLMADTRERLAEYAHEAWSGWMQYMFSKSIQQAGGRVTIPARLVERWTREMNTEYAALPEGEKASDRDEADKMLAIMEGRAVAEMLEFCCFNDIRDGCTGPGCPCGCHEPVADHRLEAYCPPGHGCPMTHPCHVPGCERSPAQHPR